MLLQIGGGMGLPLERVVCILNARQLGPETRRLFEHARRERRYTACAGHPRAYLIATDAAGHTAVYESTVAAATLERRWREAHPLAQVRAQAVLTVTAAE
jgi:hypothetical protein